MLPNFSKHSSVITGNHSGRKIENLNQCKKDCLAAANGSLKDDHILIVVGDVEKTADCENIVKKTVQHFGQLDILVNSAGIISKGTTESTPLAEYDT